MALWSWNVDDDTIIMDERAFELWGQPKSRRVTFEDLSSHIHSADRDRVRAAFVATRAIVGPYEIDFRIIFGDKVRCISARGQGDDVGIVGRVMSGIFLDVTGRKQAEEAHELLAGEMSHRVKNLLAIASALTTIASRSAETTADMVRELTQRLTALRRAHELVRSAPGKEAKAALLGDLLSVLLAPYDDMGAFSGRDRVSVPKLESERRLRLRWLWLCTSWRPTRSSTELCLPRTARWMCRVLRVGMRWSSCGSNGAAH